MQKSALSSQKNYYVQNDSDSIQTRMECLSRETTSMRPIEQSAYE